MTAAELRRIAKRSAVTARIVSDGARSYFVEILAATQTSVLADPQGKVLLFLDISQARNLLRKAKVTTISLSMRIAADEACAGPITERSGAERPGFAKLPLIDNR